MLLHFKKALVPLVLCMGTIPLTTMAEDATSAAGADQGKPAMGHSIGDTKAMARMPDSRKTPEEAKPNTNEEHVMMNHSPADAKAMRGMKKKPKIHHAGEPVPSSKEQGNVMMDHSVGDTKAMARMPDRTKIPVQQSGGDSTAAPAGGDKK